MTENTLTANGTIDVPALIARLDGDKRASLIISPNLSRIYVSGRAGASACIHLTADAADPTVATDLELLLPYGSRRERVGLTELFGLDYKVEDALDVLNGFLDRR